MNCEKLNKCIQLLYSYCCSFHDTEYQFLIHKLFVYFKCNTKFTLEKKVSKMLAVKNKNDLGPWKAEFTFELSFLPL